MQMRMSQANGALLRMATLFRMLLIAKLQLLVRMYLLMWSSRHQNIVLLRVLVTLPSATTSIARSLILSLVRWKWLSLRTLSLSLSLSDVLSAPEGEQQKHST